MRRFKKDRLETIAGLGEVVATFSVLKTDQDACEGVSKSPSNRDAADRQKRSSGLG